MTNTFVCLVVAFVTVFVVLWTLLPKQAPQGLPKRVQWKSSLDEIMSASAVEQELPKQMRRMTFEVFGKVQKVFMRKYTKKAADRYGVRGYIFNTEAKTVKGEACAPHKDIKKFKVWLQTKGSPKSRIDRAVFSNETDVENCDDLKPTFEIRKIKLANGQYWA